MRSRAKLSIGQKSREFFKFWSLKKKWLQNALLPGVIVVDAPPRVVRDFNRLIDYYLVTGQNDKADEISRKMLDHVKRDIDN